MDVREKLIELLKEVVAIQQCGFGDPRPTYETAARYLIANGVTVRECKLGAKKTNADRIRKMNDEELKKFICSMFKCEFCDFELGERCGLLNWLQMPAEEG